jgi:hypothetical protein
VDAVIDPWHPALELGGAPPEIRHPALVFVAQSVNDASLTADRLVNDPSMLIAEPSSDRGIGRDQRLRHPETMRLNKAALVWLAGVRLHR